MSFSKSLFLLTRAIISIFLITETSPFPATPFISLAYELKRDRAKATTAKVETTDRLTNVPL